MIGLKDGECPKCGSKEIIDNAKLADKYEGNLATDRCDTVVRLITRPNALFFKGRIDFKLQLYICGGCGYLESYVENPDRLAVQSQKAKDSEYM